MTLRISEPSPVRKAAARLAVKGAQASPTEVVLNNDPFCDKPVLVHRYERASSREKSIAVTMHAPCRRCAKCRQFRQMRWRERCVNELLLAVRSWWVTLTLSPSMLRSVEAEAMRMFAKKPSLTMTQCIERCAYQDVNLYFKRLRHHIGGRFRAVVVFELGEKTGRPHWHLFLHEVDRPIVKSLIEREWRGIVHARLVNLDNGPQGVATYLTKYLTKSLDHRPRASRHYGYGPQFDLTPAKGYKQREETIDARKKKTSSLSGTPLKTGEYENECATQHKGADGDLQNHRPSDIETDATSSATGGAHRSGIQRATSPPGEYPSSSERARSG